MCGKQLETEKCSDVHKTKGFGIALSFLNQYHDESLVTACEAVRHELLVMKPEIGGKWFESDNYTKNRGVEFHNNNNSLSSVAGCFYEKSISQAIIRVWILLNLGWKVI